MVCGVARARRELQAPCGLVETEPPPSGRGVAPADDGLEAKSAVGGIVEANILPQPRGPRHRPKAESREIVDEPCSCRCKRPSIHPGAGDGSGELADLISSSGLHPAGQGECAKSECRQALQAKRLREPPEVVPRARQFKFSDRDMLGECADERRDEIDRIACRCRHAARRCPRRSRHRRDGHRGRAPKAAP